MKTSFDQALALLKKFYGYSSFRPGQWEVIENVIEKRDTLVLMPTGGGKSLCYQIPALMLSGCAIVISPLIALMNDQVQALRANGVPAAAVHSNIDEQTNREALRAAAEGRLKIIYISPERLLADLQNISRWIKVSLVAIDEAHCISQWGHDFRPVYTSLASVKNAFQGVPVMALTATADRLTRLDISTALGLDNPFKWIGSFDRPNISLDVLPDPGKKGRVRFITSLVAAHPSDSGIVYCLSRKKTEDMHKALLEQGCRSVCYHAGMPPEERERSQRAFVSGDAQVVCATIAFGMGIDKSNIRWVVHNNLPANIESYYQEIGRAGRDGMPAKAVLFYTYADVITRQSFAEQSGQRELNLEKLNFMQRYAEASVCRRRILLSYFSEEMTSDCGNCDNCRSPRERIDGTILAQKALSAAIRVNGGESLNNIIDILRASNRQDLIRKGYNQLRTFGAGRDLSSREWHSYMLQMVQLGLFEVAYEDNLHLRPTPFGMRVVKGLEKIQLAKFVPFEKSYVRTKPQPEPVALSPEERLMESLKRLRREVADANGIPAYMIFSDATLADMVTKKPVDLEQFAQISGVGELKLARYGKPFIAEIRRSAGLKATLPVGSSQRESLLLLNAGHTLEEIAQVRKLAVGTIASHFRDLIDNDKFDDFRKLVTLEDYNRIFSTALKENESIYDHFKDDPSTPPHILRLALAEKEWRNRHS